MLKILQARLLQYVSHKLPDVQAGFRKGRGTRDPNCQHPLDHGKSKSVPEKHLFLLYWLCQSLWLCGSQSTVENSERDGNWEICMQVRQQQLQLDMEQQTGSKQEKEYVKAVYCHPANLTYMQSTSWETLDWKKHKLESRLPGEISITSDMQMTPPLWQKVNRN